MSFDLNNHLEAFLIFFQHTTFQIENSLIEVNRVGIPKIMLRPSQSFSALSQSFLLACGCLEHSVIATIIDDCYSHHHLNDCGIIPTLWQYDMGLARLW